MSFKGFTCRVLCGLFLFSTISSAESLFVPIPYFSPMGQQAADLIDPTEPSRRLGPERLVDRARNGIDISEFNPSNPYTLNGDDFWGPEPLPFCEGAELAHFPEEGARVYYQRAMKNQLGYSPPGMFRAGVSTKSQISGAAFGKNINFRMIASLDSHAALARLSLLRRMGYRIPCLQHYRKITILFRDYEGRPDVKLKEKFLANLRDDTATDVEKRWMFPDGNSEKSAEVTLQDIVFETYGDVPNFHWGIFSPSHISYNQQSRAYRALILPIALMDLGESVNQFSPEFCRIENNSVVITTPYADAFRGNVSYEDLRWAARKIAQFNEWELNRIFEYAHYPASPEELLFEKIKSRRNHMLHVLRPLKYRKEDGGVAEFDLMAELPSDLLRLPVDLKFSRGDVEDGKQMREHYPGYALRFKYDDPEDPLSLEGIFKFFSIEAISKGLFELLAEVNEKLLQFRTIEDGQKERVQELQRKFIQHQINNPGKPYEQDVGYWTTPVINASLTAKRSVTTGTYYGSDSKVQLVDNVGVAASVGYFLGVDGLKNVLPYANTNLSIQKNFVHVRPVTDIDAAFKRSWGDLAVNYYMDDLATLLSGEGKAIAECEKRPRMNWVKEQITRLSELEPSTLMGSKLAGVNADETDSGFLFQQQEYAAAQWVILFRSDLARCRSDDLCKDSEREIWLATTLERLQALAQNDQERISEIEKKREKELQDERDADENYDPFTNTHDLRDPLMLGEPIAFTELNDGGKYRLLSERPVLEWLFLLEDELDACTGYRNQVDLQTARIKRNLFEFFNQMEVGELFIINTSLTAGASIGASIPISVLLGLDPGYGAMNASLSVGARHQWVEDLKVAGMNLLPLGRITFVKTENGIQVYDQQYSTDTWDISFDLNFWVSIFSYKYGEKWGRARNKAYLIDFDVDDASLEESRNFVSALKPIFTHGFSTLSNPTTTLAATYPETPISHSAWSRQEQGGLFWWQWLGYIEEGHEVTVKLPEPREKLEGRAKKVERLQGELAEIEKDITDDTPANDEIRVKHFEKKNELYQAKRAFDLVKEWLDLPRPVRSLYSYRIADRTGERFVGFLSDAIEAKFPGFGFYRDTIGNDPANSIFGSGKSIEVTTEAETTNGIDLNPMTIIESHWRGLRISKEEMFKIIDSLREEVKPYWMNKYELAEFGKGVDPSYEFGMVRQQEFSTTESIKLYDIGSRLLLYPEGFWKLYSAFYNPDRIDNGLHTAAQALIEMADPDEYAEFKRDHCDNGKSYTFEAEIKFAKDRKSGVSEREWKRELLLHASRKFSQEETFLGRPYMAFRDCLMGWMEEIIKLRDEIRPQTKREKTEWASRTLWILHQNTKLHRIMNWYGYENAYFQINVAGFRTNDEKGDQTYVSDSVGTYNQNWGRGPFQSFIEGTEISSSEIYARYLSEGF